MGLLSLARGSSIGQASDRSLPRGRVAAEGCNRAGLLATPLRVALAESICGFVTTIQFTEIMYELTLPWKNWIESMASGHVDIPPVAWAQRKNSVYLTIGLSDVKNPSIDLTANQLDFS
jgi:hypothetical protein